MGLRGKDVLVEFGFKVHPDWVANVLRDKEQFSGLTPLASQLKYTSMFKDSSQAVKLVVVVVSDAVGAC